MPTLTSKDYLLAKAVADQLTTLLTGQIVELVGDPRVDREDLVVLVVRVRPAAWRQEPSTRAYDIDRREVHIGIVGPCDPTDTYAIDAALALCDTVRALWGQGGALRNKVLAGHQPMGQLAQEPLWDDRTLLGNELFVGTITVTYAGSS